MKVGIIGAGNIGGSIAQNLASTGHEVRIADARGAEEIRSRATEMGVSAVEIEEVVKGVDAIVMSIPLSAVHDLAKLFATVSPEVPVIDTSNYYPFRDGAIAELDAGKAESVWVSEQIGRPVIKAFNAALAHTQATKGMPSGARGRIAIPVSGDDPRAKSIALALVEAAGFDAVDAGGLADSWRQQPGTPAYCTELSSGELRAALSGADRAMAPEHREALIKEFFAGGDSLTHEEIVARNRAVTAPK